MSRSIPPDDEGFRPYPEGEHPPYRFPRYRSSLLRAPSRDLAPPLRTLSELTGPIFGHHDVDPGEADLRTGLDGRPVVGPMIVVEGRVSDEAGRPVPETLVEVWQANAAGKYHHPADGFDAPVDPNFRGCGRVVTDREGRYRLVTIKPGPYPVQNTGNWWRPPHIHFSLFGPSFLTRLVTQMYFPGDPLNDMDHILAGIGDSRARERLIAALEPSIGLWETALGYRFDIVLRGPRATPMVD